MARINRHWFEFKGIRSSDLGVYPVDAPFAATGAPRVTAHAVSGRDGCLYLSDNSLSEFDITRTLRIPAGQLRTAQSWLCGAGELRFSHEADALYDARILKNVEYRQILPGDDGLWECKVAFSCQPHPYLYPPAGESVFTAPGDLPTPEGMLGAPRITITGGGAFTLAIGGDMLVFSGVEGGIIVDSLLGDALTPDGAQLANEQVSGALPALESPLNHVSWTLGSDSETGYVDEVRILPRWKWK